MKRINLFVDAHVFDGMPQGTVTFIAGLYSELIKDPRFQIYVGSNNKNTAIKLLKSENFIHIKINTQSKIKRLLYVLPILLKKNKIDFAHFQYISPLFKSCKYIVTIHDLLFLDFPSSFPWLYRVKNSAMFYISSKRADMITTVSEYSRNSIERHFKISSKKVILTPDAISLPDNCLEPIYELLNKKFILYVSRIEPRKNQALLLEVWKSLSLINREFSLVFVGAEGIRDERLISQIESLQSNERENFYWYKFLPKSNVNWLYKNCSLFVYPSIAEGFGIPPIEAAVYGAKVLCSNQTAMRDFSFFEDFQFSPFNIREFKSKLEWALSHEFPHKTVKEIIVNKYSWKKVSQDLAQEIIKLTQ